MYSFCRHNRFPDYVYKVFRNDLSRFNMNDTLIGSQTDLPRLRKGMVRGQFWAAYAPCDANYKDAVARTFEQIDVMKRIIQMHPEDLRLALSVQG